MASDRHFGAKETEFEQNPQFFKRGAAIASLLNFLEQSGKIKFDWQGKQVVELGSGDGSGLWALRMLGANAVGVDTGDEGTRVDLFKKSSLVADTPYYDLDSYEFLVSQPDESFEAICVFNVVSDVWPDEVSNEAYRVLKTNGIVVMTWQYANFGIGDGNWPKGWPRWRGSKDVFQTFSKERQIGKQSLIQEVFDPRSLALGQLVSSPDLSADDIGAVADAFVMIGRKSPL